MFFADDLHDVAKVMPYTAWSFGPDVRRIIGRAALTSGEHLTFATLVAVLDAGLHTKNGAPYGVSESAIRLQTRLSEGTTRKHLRRLLSLGLVIQRGPGWSVTHNPSEG